MTGKEFMNAVADIMRLVETYPTLKKALPPEILSQVE